MYQWHVKGEHEECDERNLQQHILNQDDLAGAGGEDADPLRSELLQGVQFHSLESRDESVLFDMEPAFVLMYDPDIAFVRQLEVWVRAFSAGTT
jgi:hypothetical protein